MRNSEPGKTKQQRTPIVMPQVGEGISEATIIVWHKKVGDAVKDGDPLLDVTTAKIDIEIPAPVDGVVEEIRFPAEATVPVDTVIAVIAPKGTAVAAPAAARPAEGVSDVADPETATESPEVPTASLSSETADAPEIPASPVSPAAAAESLEAQRRGLLRKRGTPLVRRIARDMGIDLSMVVGTGLHGRVTRRDLEAYLERKQSAARTRKGQKPGGVALAASPEARQKEALGDPIAHGVAEKRSEPMSHMRKMIAEHMERSYRRSPHAFTVFEFDFTRAERLRLRHREAFRREVGVNLTPLGFILKAIADVLPRFPIITAFLRDDEIVYPSEVNLGVAVAIPNGLLVPVIHEVEGRSIEDLTKALHDVAARARQGKLMLNDVEGGTFTVTSPGQQGCKMGIPIINQPQSAILHIGAIAKQPAVVTSADGEDSIAVRHRAICTLGFDHRLIDGWEADSFMSALRERIESGQFALDSYI